MFLHTILSLKQIYPTEKGEKEMFEITYSDNDLLENYQECGKRIHKECTFHRYGSGRCTAGKKNIRQNGRLSD